MSKLPSDLIIVLGRQFGSGGRYVGKRLAEELNLEYYDKEVLSESARRMGFRQEIFARYDEKRPSALRSFLSNAFGDTYVNGDLGSETIYGAQSRVIRELADKGGCVFVGRSADYILRDRKNLVSIFLHSPIEKRAGVLVERGDADSADKAMEMARKFDRKREDFYNYFTGRNWGHSDNYHLSIDSSLLGKEATVKFIMDYLRYKYEE